MGSENFADNGVTFELSSTSTPNIDSISPTTENSVNSVLTITGTGFSETAGRYFFYDSLQLILNWFIINIFNAKADLNVTIGNSTCEITSASITEIVCTLGKNRAGMYKVLLTVKPYGFANQNKQITYNLTLSSLSNSICIISILKKKTFFNF